MYARYFKRIFDFCAALAVVAALSPLYVLSAVLIRASMGSPVLFRQERPGFKGRTFRVLKFRSMTSETDENGNPLPDARRMTAVGRFIRKTSIDELPQMFNVLAGDMSFVGPRPLLTRYLPYYTAEENRRHDVRPGITGLAQVNGRNCISWDEKLAYDVEYVKNVSFLLDLKICLKTVVNILAGKDVETVNTEIFFDVDRREKLSGQNSYSGKKSHK